MPRWIPVTRFAYLSAVGRSERERDPAMDERTARYYDAHARELAGIYEDIGSQQAEQLRRSFPRGGRILDIGSGSGRDAAGLVAEGFETWAVEPSAQFRAISVERHPSLAKRVVEGHLPDGLPDPGELGGKFDGILLSAVLQHIPRFRILEAIQGLKRLLLPGGRVLVSIPETRPGLDGESRDEFERLFTRIHPPELQLLFERAGFTLVDSWRNPDPLERAGHSWAFLLLRLESATGARPIDRIETVLSGDRKVTTYKLALIRAMAETAISSPHLAVPLESGNVTIPLRHLGALWVRYYWPLVEAVEFLPQYQGDWKAKTHRFKFARELRSLVGRYRSRGGLGAFDADLRSGGLKGPDRAAYEGTLRKAVAAIREGPVRHAGATSPAGPLVTSDPGRVTVDRHLWRELSLMGHWIADAVVLRWAEETRRFSGESVPVSDVVEALLGDEVPERTQAVARKLYEGHPSLACVWTGRALHWTKMEIDHVIPHSLWQNNDLWNLLPTTESVNRKKRDRLPTQKALRNSHDAILGCWSFARERMERRFVNEVTRWTGRARVTDEQLFGLVCEAVEVTALQRGAGRWPDDLPLPPSAPIPA